MPFVSDRWSVEVRWFHDKTSHGFPNSIEFSVFYFRSVRRFQEFLTSLVKIFILHGKIWIHWAARSCTTTACRWMSLDSHPSLRTLWSAIIKSPNFLLEVKLRQCVFCEGPCHFGSQTDFAIPVFWEVLTLCIPDFVVTYMQFCFFQIFFEIL